MISDSSYVSLAQACVTGRNNELNFLATRDLQGALGQLLCLPKAGQQGVHVFTLQNRLLRSEWSQDWWEKISEFQSFHQMNVATHST